MMTTPQEEALARQIAMSAGIPFDMALGEARIKMAQHRGVVTQAAVAKAQADAAAAPRSIDDSWSSGELAQLDRNLDPQRVAARAREREQIEAQMRPLVEQRDILNRQIAVLNEEWRRWM